MSLHEETHTIRCFPEMWKQLSIKTAMEGTNNSAKIRELINQYLLIDEDTQEKDYKEELLQKSEERGYVSPGYIVYIAQKHNTSLSTINKYCDEENIKIKE